MAEEKKLSQLDVKDIFSKVNLKFIFTNKSFKEGGKPPAAGAGFDAGVGAGAGAGVGAGAGAGASSAGCGS